MIYEKRNIEKINTLTQKGILMAKEWIGKLKTAKREVLITSGYRTKSEQDALYALGRTKPGKIVTNNKGGTSSHNFHIAIDFCPVDNKGNLLWSDVKKFKQYAAVAKMCGFEWGGDWKKFPDQCHLQYKD